ncbi:MAG: BON domain-containing protein, partial [Planctomycetota bacterium]
GERVVRPCRGGPLGGRLAAGGELAGGGLFDVAAGERRRGRRGGGVTTADATAASPFAGGDIEQTAARQFAARRKAAAERAAATRPNNPFAQIATPPTAPEVRTASTPAFAATPAVASAAAFTAPKPQAAPAPKPQPAPAAPVTAPTPKVESNQAVAVKIGEALKGAGLAGYEMKVSYQDGVCVLGGTIADPQQAAKAYQVAASVPGVRAVQNNLTVKPVQTASAAANPYGAVSPAALAAAPAALGAAAAGAPMLPPGKMLGNGAYGPVPTAPVAGGPVYNNPGLPNYAYPTTSQYPNYASVSYPQQYSASAWPYIGPFYPYPQVPLGWREVSLEWDDGQWYLDFNDRTDRWWWFLSPKNW